MPRNANAGNCTKAHTLLTNAPTTKPTIMSEAAMCMSLTSSGTATEAFTSGRGRMWV
jgi:hypothetical protein